MSPWPPEGEPSGKGTSAGDASRPGHADLAGALKFGHDDVRNALERASARQTAAHVAAGAIAKALLAASSASPSWARRSRSAARRARKAGSARPTTRAKDRDTLGGVVEVVAEGVPPGLGSYATKEDRLDARLAAALMGIQAVKGVEIGEGFALARLRGSQAHDEIEPGLARDTNRAGGLEGGVTNGEPARRPRGDEAAADSDAPAPVRRSRVRGARGRPRRAERRRRRSRRSRSWPRQPSRGSSRAPPGRSSAATPSGTSSPRTAPTWSGSAGPCTERLDRHVALIGFMGAGSRRSARGLAERHRARVPVGRSP